MKLAVLLLVQLAEPYDTPKHYYDLWQETAACAGYEVTNAELDSIEFWHVNASTFIAEGHLGYVGYAYVEHNEIYIARPFKGDNDIIKHEMLHFILWWRKEGYTGGHPEEFEICKI